MSIDYRLSKVVIKCFRGVEDLTIDLRDGYPTVLIGANNAGKSTILNAMALALNGGGYHQFSPTEDDLYCADNGNRSSEFLVQVHFHSNHGLGYPAVKGVAKPSMVDIREHAPEVWLFRPQNIESSLYVWKTGPIAKLSRLLAARFLTDEWQMELGEGKGPRKMPHTMHAA